MSVSTINHPETMPESQQMHLLKPISQSAIEAFTQFVGMDCVETGITDFSSTPLFDLKASIRISSDDYHCCLLVDFPHELIVLSAQTLLGCTPGEGDQSLITDLVCEFANLIAGATKTHLKNAENFVLGLPEFVELCGFPQSIPANIPGDTIMLTTSGHSFAVHAFIENSAQ